MKTYLLLPLLLLWVLLHAGAAELPVLNPDPSEVAVGGAPLVPAVSTEQPAGKLVPRDRTRVAVLGYHNFSETKPVTEMCMRSSEFRQQMETIRRSGCTVISMREFLEWLLGSRELPARCVLITLDDGWKSVYTDAYPILKEYGYPFHLFLYTSYLSGRGDSMTPAQIREMMEHGATVGSHSVTHDYPKVWKAYEAQGPEAYTRHIDAEIGGSFTKLSELFGSIDTYCFPGGYITPPMLERLPGYGYRAAFTVVPGKVGIGENPFQIHRYMVFGNDPSIFRHAMDFRPTASVPTTGREPGTLPSSTPLPPFSVSPKPQETVGCDIPAITASMGELSGVDFSSVRMAVSGFGRVPAKLDANTRTVQWTPPMRIYMPHISVHLSWNDSDGTAHKAEWSFAVDPASAPKQP